MWLGDDPDIDHCNKREDEQNYNFVSITARYEAKDAGSVFPWRAMKMLQCAFRLTIYEHGGQYKEFCYDFHPVPPPEQCGCNRSRGIALQTRAALIWSTPSLSVLFIRVHDGR